MLRGQHIPGAEPVVSLKWTIFGFFDYPDLGLREEGAPSERRRWGARGDGSRLPGGTRPSVVELPHHFQERPHDPWVELSPGVPLDLLHGGLPGDPVAVRPVADHRVEGVGHGDHARLQGYVLAAQPVRVPPAVEALVVVPDN